jgi:hypothetical protein
VSPTLLMMVPRLRCVAAVAVLACALPAFASLGGDVTSVETDRAHMAASVRVTQPSSNYSVHEIQSPEGTVVQEYVSPAGKVFAVTWRGQFMPQMQQILGNYFQEYSAALQAQPRRYGRRPLNIQRSDLVVQTGGQMRNYFGRAYVPGMLPQGVSTDSIR